MALNKIAPFYRYTNFFKNVPFIEQVNKKKSYSLDELFYSKNYNIKRKSIPYNEQYEQHDMEQKPQDIKCDRNIFPEWTMFVHRVKH